MPESKYKIAIYCRIAHEDQLAMEMQEASLRIYAKTNGLDKYGIELYSDNGYSGLSFDRPAFSRLEHDVQAGTIGAIIVKDLSRIGRNISDTLAWLDLLHNKGIVFIEAKQPLRDVFLQNRGCYQKFIEGVL